VADEFGAELTTGLSCAKHVLAFEQAVDFDAAAGQKTEDEGAMRDRFIARRPDASAQGAAAARGERGAGFGDHQQTPR
jgi:hypothetical protein